MNKTGMTRKIDDLGRITIPKEIRDNFGLQEHDSLQFSVNKEYIMLKKYNHSCIFCNTEDNIIDYKNQLICWHCLNELKKN